VQNCANFVSQALYAAGVEPTSLEWNISQRISTGVHNPIWTNKVNTYILREILGFNIHFNAETLNNHPVFVTSTWNSAYSQFRYFSDPKNGFINGEVITIDRNSDISQILATYNIQVGDLLHMDFNGNGRMNHATIISNVINGELYLAGNTADWFDESFAEWLPGFFASRPDGVLSITLLNDSMFGDCSC